jgi:multidrug resistance efflux pump
MDPLDTLRALSIEMGALVGEWQIKHQSFSKGLAAAEHLYRDVKAQLLTLKEVQIVSISEYGVALEFYRKISKRRRELQRGRAVCEHNITKIQSAIDNNQAALQAALAAVDCEAAVPNNILEFPCKMNHKSDTK